MLNRRIKDPHRQASEITQLTERLKQAYAACGVNMNPAKTYLQITEYIAKDETDICLRLLL